ncbi:unnamed protein product [Boreogadus saida]
MRLGVEALLDIGIYCLQFRLHGVPGGAARERPASGGLPGDRVEASLHSHHNTHVEMVPGTEGSVRVPAHMWCPTSLIVNGEETQYPLPEPYLPTNFLNSTGMRYEAEEVRQCLLKGLKESPGMTHADSVLLAWLEDEARRQVGVEYSQDHH